MHAGRATAMHAGRASSALVTAAALALATALLGGCGSQDNRRPAAPGSASATSHGADTAPGQGSAGSGSSSARGPTGETPQLRTLIALGKPIYCGARRGDEVALTFDDGPGVYTRLVLAKLRKHGIQATFFDVSRNIPLLPGATREEAAIGGLGDHTINHPLLTGLAPAEAQAEIAGAQSALERASGTPVFLFRPPYGGRSEGIDAIARSRGMLEIMWTVDSADSLGADYAQIERNVIAGLHGGAIILMHENHGQTVRALLGIFAALQRRHLRTVSVASLLSDDPPSAAQVRAGGAGCGVAPTGSNGG